MEKGGIKVAQKGTIFVVQMDGLVANPSRETAPYYDEFTDGQIRPDTGILVAVLNGKATNAKALAVGDKVYLLKVKTAANAFTFEVQSCGACDPNAVDLGHQPRRAELTFKFAKGALAAADFGQIKQVIEKVFKFPEDVPATEAAAPTATPAPTPTEPQNFAPIAPPTPAAAAPFKLKLGLTIEEVKAGLGDPLTIADKGATVLYVYKDWKVTFTDGKVSDIE
jgi:hypothetical protein